MSAFVIDVLLKNDTCFAGDSSSPTGRVDTEVERDPVLGLPVLRGRTLKGLLVEEVAWMLRTLESAGSGPWHDAAAALFGEPGRHDSTAGLAFRDGTLPAAVVTNVAQRVASRQWQPDDVYGALTTIRRQTKIDRASGAPAARSLRATRLTRAGLRFVCPVDAERALTHAERALLAAGVAALRRAGLHRNEGWGRVEARLLEAGQDVTATALAGLEATSAPTPVVPVSAAVSTDPAASGGRTVVTFRLRLQAPALLRTLGGDPSTAESLPYVSGSAIRGAMAGRWLSHGAPPDPALDPTFRALFLDGRARWLNAYPPTNDGARMCPAPRSFLCDKRQQPPTVAWDQAAPEWRSDLGARAPDDLGPLPEDTFVSLRADGTLLHRRPRVQARLHHRREDREKGRSSDGDMFTYVSLIAGQAFVGHVLCADEGITKMVEKLLREATLPVGRSRTAGYGGHAQIESVTTRTATGWAEFADPATDADEEPDAEGRCFALLLSDYLGRNEHGVADPDAIYGDLSAALAVNADDLRATPGFVGARPVSGHVAVWRMPRPNHPALVAGSVFVLPTLPDPQRAAALEWAGIGERRAEGFGRVKLLWAADEPFTVKADPVALDAPIPPPLDPQTEAQASADVEAAVLRALCARHLAEEARRDVKRTRRPPPAALVARLRTQVRCATGGSDVTGFLTSLNGKPAAGKLDACRIGSRSLREHVAELIADWPQSDPLTQTVRAAGLSVEALGDETRWQLAQGYLDAFCESLRRQSASNRGVE